MLLLLLALVGAAGRAAAAATENDSLEPSVLMGAIRWDAWFGAPADPHSGIVGRAVTQALTPPKYHYRLPFFARLTTNRSGGQGVVVDGDSDAVMAQENKLAAQHGLDYFAFCTYPIGCKDYSPPASECVGAQCCADNYRLSYALERYLSSKGTLGADKPRFALILQASSWYPVATHGGNESLAREAERLAGYFALDAYQKVGGRARRPLVFLLGGSAQTPQLPQALELLRSNAAAMGVGEPFLVMMQNAPTAAALAQLANRTLALGAHGLSQYHLRVISIQIGTLD